MKRWALRIFEAVTLFYMLYVIIMTDTCLVFVKTHKMFFHSSVGKESTCNAGDPLFDSWVRKICWKRDRLPTPVFLGFPYGSAGKQSTYNVGDLGSIPRLGRSPEEGKGYPLQYSGLENSMDYTVHGVTKSQTRLSDLHFHTSHKMFNTNNES